MSHRHTPFFSLKPTSTDKSSGWNVGAVLDQNGPGVTLGAHAGKGNTDGQSTTYTNSHVGTLSGTTLVQTGDTITIKGGQVLGERENASVNLYMTHQDINIIHSRSNAIEPIIKFTFVLVNDTYH
ncbi:hemagglutinin repeat-containing protein [Sulfurovum mangrovi]|uniref:hemagglutinin repeat-containing protein n=1 Tax=Sulfurovum mangrovi TaxID=2893889 RepID=UPI001E62F18B|nr:hemagglutinin repeat-containing protein [Sulfurovum mangrovi]UFH58043.1 hemagglutinin repeat-containing protein [Sulfurovum mangrovi]